LEEPWAISYVRTCCQDCVKVITAINGRKWPVPIPKGANLDTIQEGLLKMGAEYVWLDLLCLRQKNGQREDLHVDKWKTDVPTIRSIHRWAEVVVHYFDVLRETTNLDNSDGGNHCWFNRTWPFQE
ncbi:uncharacterized protein EV420DRAFT_1239513, partial [Desarmillaria tabescens]